MSFRNKVLAAVGFTLLIVGAIGVWWPFASETEKSDLITADSAATNGEECVEYGVLLIETGEAELGEEALALCIKKHPSLNVNLKTGERGARREFDSLMKGWAPPWPDEFGVAQTDLSDQQLAKHLEDIDSFINGHSGGYHAKLAVTVKSLILYRQRDYRGCADLLADNASALADLAMYLSALSYLNMNNRDEAYSLVDRLLREQPNSLYASRAGLLKATALMDDQNYRAAVETAIAVANKSDDPIIKGRALIVASKIYRAAGDNAGAVAMLVEIARNYPAADVEDLLDDYIDPATDLVSADDSVALAEYFVKKKRGYPIIRFLSKSKTLTPRGSYLLAKGYLLNGNIKDADRTAGKIGSRGASDETRGDVCVLKADILRAKSKTDAAMSQLKGCAANHIAVRRESLERIAKIYQQKNNEKERIKTLLTLLDIAPDHEMSGDFLLEVARARLNAGSRRKAAEVYSVLASANPPKAASAEATFWLGKIAYDAGKSSEARKYFEDTMNKFPFSYYYFRAGDYLKAMNIVVPDFTDIVLEKRNSYNFEPSSDLRLLSGNALRNMHLYDESLRHFKAAAVDDPNGAAMGAAKALRDKGRLMDSVRAIDDRAKANPEFYFSVLGSPYLTELLYPTLYFDSARIEALRAGLDGAWPFAIIRQESRFVASATSSSNAKGLMQIIPSTGSWISSFLKDTGYSDDKLYDPDYNIKYGSWYFNYLLGLKDIKGNIALAVAAYNGGPGNVRRWKEAYGARDMDVFIEKIPKDETRDYTKKVLLNYYAYRAILNQENRTLN